MDGEHTFGFEVTVNEAHQVQILQRRCDLGGVEAGVVFAHAFAGSCLQGSEEFAAAAVFHTQVEVVFGLKGVVEGDDEGVVAGGQDLLLGKRSLYLVPLDHFLFAEDCWRSVHIHSQNSNTGGAGSPFIAYNRFDFFSLTR